MTDPSQPPRQTTRVMQAMQASHESPLTVPRYVVGAVLLLFALGMFAFHVITHYGESLGVFEQRFIAACALAGFGVMPPAEALVRFLFGLVGAWRKFKAPPSGSGQ
jgi:hypothetical protein